MRFVGFLMDLLQGDLFDYAFAMRVPQGLFWWDPSFMIKSLWVVGGIQDFSVRQSPLGFGFWTKRVWGLGLTKE